MKVNKEKVKRASGKTIRSFAQSEVQTVVYYGGVVSEEQTAVKAMKVGAIYDVEKLFGDLAALLKCYPDFTVEETELGVVIKGETQKTIPKEVENVERIEFYYRQKTPYTVIVLDDEKELNCLQTDLLENLEKSIVFHWMLWIADDDKVKEFYLSFLELIMSYRTQILNQKEEFLDILLYAIAGFAKKEPEEKVQLAPVTYNLPFLLHQMYRELLEYELKEANVDLKFLALGIMAARKDYHYLATLDIETFNGLKINFQSKSISVATTLNAEQVVKLAQFLIPKLQEWNNLFCKQFALVLLDTLYEQICWAETDSPMDDKEKYNRILKA